jgi:hypothetical protein
MHRKTPSIHIIRRRPLEPSALESPARVKPSNHIDFLLSRLSRGGGDISGPGSLGGDARMFSHIVDAVFDANPHGVESGVNHDSFPDATFESLESPIFLSQGKEYSIFISRQTAPEEDEPSYREISVLRQRGRDPKDPRPSRVVSLMLITRDKQVNLTQPGGSNDGNRRQMRTIWNFFLRHHGRVLLSNSNPEK